MALDWRTCSSVEGKNRREGDESKALAGFGAEAGASSAAATDDGAASDGLNKVAGGVSVAGSGFFIRQVGGGSSFFGGQGLFLWSPSVERHLPGGGREGEQLGNAWGGGGGDNGGGVHSDDAKQHPAMNSWGGGGSAMGDSWDAALREGTASPEVQPDVEAGCADADEFSADVYQHTIGSSLTGGRGLDQIREELVASERNTPVPRGDEESLPSDSSPTKARDPASPAGAMDVREASVNVPVTVDGNKTAADPTTKVNGELSTTLAAASFVAPAEEPSEMATPSTRKFAVEQSPQIVKSGAGTDGEGSEAAVTTATAGGDATHRSEGTQDDTAACLPPHAPGVEAMDSAHSPSAGARGADEAFTSIAAPAPAADSAVTAGPVSWTDKRLGGEAPANAAAITVADPDDKRTPVATILTNKEAHRCSCSCHDAHLHLPPTPPQTRSSRISRRQQRRRASAPEKRGGDRAGGSNGCTSGSGRDEPCDQVGVVGGAAAVGTPGDDAGIAHAGRVPGPLALARTLSEDSRRVPNLRPHQLQQQHPQQHPLGCASVAAVNSLSSLGKLVLGSGSSVVGGAGMSPERKSDYSVRTPPRSERRHPRSSTCGSVGSTSGGGRGGRGHDGPSSVPGMLLSNVRRRKSESGLRLMAATTRPSSDAPYSGSVGGRIRSRRSKSSAGAHSGVHAAVGAAPGVTVKVKARTPPAWSWNPFNAGEPTTSRRNAAGGDGGGAAAGRGYRWSRVRSDSDACLSAGRERATGDTALTSHIRASPAAAVAAGEGWVQRPGRGSVEQNNEDNGGGAAAACSVFRSRGGSWDSDPRDGYELRIDRDLKAGRAGARSAPRGGPARRMFGESVRSMSEAARGARDDSIQGRVGRCLLLCFLGAEGRQ